MRGIRIVPVRPAFAPAAQRLASDPAIGATSNVPSPYPRDGARSWIADSLAKWKTGEEFTFAVLASGCFVGACGLRGVDRDRNRAEMGYWIGRPFWGRGYATAAGRRLLEFAFRRARLAFVTSSCLERNPASARVLEKLGFRFTGTGGNDNPKWGVGDVFRLYELSREEWRNR